MSPPDLYPTDTLEWLLAATGVQADYLRSPELLAALDELNRRFLAGDPGDYAAEPTLRRAYTLYYLPINLAKVAFVLDRAPGLVDVLTDGATLRDLGCGPGTMTWGLLFWLRAHRPDALARLAAIQAVDRSPEFLALGERLWEEARRRWPELTTAQWGIRQGDWRQAGETPADLLLAGNVLNETPPEPSWAEAVTARGVLLIEPGTRAGFAQVLPVREGLRAANWHLHFPCPGAGDCPMAARPDDWCHFHIHRFAWSWLHALAQRTGRHRARHHFSGLVATAPAATTGDSSRAAAGHEQRWRVMSNLRKTGRSGIRYLCDGSRLLETVVNRRERSPANRPFFAAATGDALRIAPGAEGRRRFPRDPHLRADDRCEPADEPPPNRRA